MTRDTEFGVVEMGASACGELALLTSVAEPGYGILTNIGRAHRMFPEARGNPPGQGRVVRLSRRERGAAPFVPSDDRVLTEMAAERDSLAGNTIPSRWPTAWRTTSKGPTTATTSPPQ